MAAEPWQILLVDDEPEVLEALYLTLKRARQFQCELRRANGGPEALEELARKPAHLVLADFRMPKMNGVELLKAVKDRWPDTIRALVTGYSDVEIAMQAMEQARIHYYVQKPWNNDELRLTVWEALKSHKAGSGDPGGPGGGGPGGPGGTAAGGKAGPEGREGRTGGSQGGGS